MKYLKLIAIAFYFAFFIFPSDVSAHILKSEGTVGAVLHISPQDDPAAGELTTLFLSFKDTANLMMLSDCDCRLSVLKNGEIISTVPLLDDAVASTIQRSTARITFPEIGVYELLVEGSPKTGDSFIPFVLRYPIRVTRSTQIPVADSIQKSDQSGSLLEQSSFQKEHIQLVISALGIALMGALSLKIGNRDS